MAVSIAWTKLVGVQLEGAGNQPLNTVEAGAGLHRVSRTILAREAPTTAGKRIIPHGLQGDGSKQQEDARTNGDQQQVSSDFRPGRALHGSHHPRPWIRNQASKLQEQQDAEEQESYGRLDHVPDHTDDDPRVDGVGCGHGNHECAQPEEEVHRATSAIYRLMDFPEHEAGVSASSTSRSRG